MGQEIAGWLVPLGVFAMVVFIVWFGTRQKQVSVQARTDFHKHLLDKFGSGTELAQFLESEGGKKMLEDLAADRVSPQERALTHVRAGVILTGLGIGFLVLTTQNPDLVFPGGLLAALGMGFLVAAWASRRLAKSWSRDSESRGPEGDGLPGQ